MYTTPPSLLRRLRDPAQREAWDVFVELYTPLLFVWSRRWGLQESDAADLVQETLLLLYRKLPEFEYRDGSSFRGWLRTVLLNKWRETRRRLVPQPVGDGLDPAVEPGWAEQEEQEYRRQLLRVILKKLKPEFPATIWSAFEAYVLEGRPPRDVAARMGISPATVYAAKSKVFQRIRQELAGMLE
ncbi:MAG: RNA polymerase sigma factor [Gemmataceae bacterium]|nr:RNA polymerase sigma factor [Gemmataceae bacterium]